MKIRILLAVLIAFALNNCASIQDDEGWTSEQKNEFLKILETDEYASICNKQLLYEKVKSTEDSRLMSNLLMHYAHNLANSCIDMQSFAVAQNEKLEKGISTYFEINQARVDYHNIRLRLQSKQSILQILQPYVPQTKQFFTLIRKYNALKSPNAVITSEQLYRIRLNIERAKLMRKDLGRSYALINIPEYKVRFIDKNDSTALSFGVIVGKPKMQTPIFSAPMKYLTINPQWSVPDSIARNEIIPAILRNPKYLASHNMVIRKSYDLESEVVDVNSVDWKQYAGGKGSIPYRFIEKPSRRNVLGRVKFIFPNEHSVYMHDTQSKNLFKHKSRPFSHGCIRLEKPIELLDYVSTNYTNKDFTTAKSLHDSLKTHHLRLNRDLMVHTTYFTVYVGNDDVLRIYSDVYGYDKSQRLNFKV